MSTYTGSAFATKYAAYLIYKGSATAAALNISQPKIGYVYDITEGGTLTPGNITVQQGDAVVYLAQGWTHCNNGGADQAIANLSSQFDELLEEIGETDFSKFALKTELPTVPTNVSAFTNDAGYLTEHQSLANYALKTEIPNVSNLAPYSAIPQNVSQLTNDVHYLTEAVLNDRVRKVDDLAQDTDAADGEIVQLTTDGRFYRFTEPQAEGESGTWTTINQPADIASNDQILSQNNSGELTATLGMSYNSTNQHLELKGINDAVVAYVDMAVFIKDGMLENVEKYTTPEQGVSVAVPYLKFTFNTDSGKSVIRISFADLIDTFDGSNVDLTSAFVKAATYSAPTIGDSMNVAIGKLLKGHEDNAAAIATKQDTLTFDDAPQSGSNRPVTSQGIKAAIDSAIGGVPNALKQKDLTTYQGTDGEIVQHIGTTSGNYTNGYVYKFANIVISKNTPFLDARELTGYEEYVSQTIYVGTQVVDGWWIYQGTPAAYGWAYTFAITDLYVGATVLFGNAAVGVGIVGTILSDKFIVAVGNELLEVPIPSTPYSSYDIYYMHDIYGVADSWAYLNVNQILKYNETSQLWNAEYTTKNVSALRPYSRSTDYPIASGWQRINVQPSSEGAVSDLETRMTVAETAIQGKQATITGAASTITTANLTASKVLGSDANGKVAATSIATADAEDAVAKRHTQNTDTRILSPNQGNSVTCTNAGTVINGITSISGSLSVSGNLNVTGKETVEEIVNIKSENNFITLRDGAQTAIASGSLSGTKVENYDGLNNDLLFGTDASGVFRIGDEGGTLEPIMTRAEAANLADADALIWDATNQRAIGTKTLSGVTAAKAIDGNFGRLGGANQAVSRTVEDLMTEVTTSGGICGGSINIATASKGVGTGWYNFIYIPHRTGVGDDNPSYGTLIMTSMSTGGNLYVINKSNNVIADARVYRTAASNWTNDRVLISYGGAISSSSVTSTELGYLSGVTSNVQTQLNAKAPSANTVNGAPLSNAASYFYGVSTSAANATQKEVSIPSITTLNAGQVIVVVPTITSDTILNATLKLNNFAAYSLKYGNLSQVEQTTWMNSIPSMYVFTGNAWVFLCRGFDTYYNQMSVAEGTAGTATTSRVVRADYLQQIIHGQIDKFVGTRAMTEDAYWDLVAAGTVQADTLYITYDNDWEG